MNIEESKIKELDLIENPGDNHSISLYSMQKLYEESVESQDANDEKVNEIKLNLNIPYSRTVYEFISEHKKWKRHIMAGRKQSKDLYRTDNLCKKTWRALRQIVAKKTKNLINSLPARLRTDSVSVHAKIKRYLCSFELAHDLRTYYTLLSCMVFLAMKRSYTKIIKTPCFSTDVVKFMTKQVKAFQSFNENKTGYM